MHIQIHTYATGVGLRLGLLLPSPVDQICKWVFKNMIICKKVVSKGWCKESRQSIIISRLI